MSVPATLLETVMSPRRRGPQTGWKLIKGTVDKFYARTRRNPVHFRMLDSVAEDIHAESKRLGLSACEYVEAVLTMHIHDPAQRDQLETMLKLYR